MKKNADDYIRLCRQYSDASLIPTSFRDGAVVLYSYQSEQMNIPYSQNPDTYLYNPVADSPVFCGVTPNVLYAQIPIEGTSFNIYLGPVFPMGVTDEILHNLMQEQVIPRSHKDELREYILHIPTMSRSQLARHILLIHSLVNETPLSYKSLLGYDDYDSPSKKVTYFDDNHTASENLPQFENRFYYLVSSGNREELLRFLNTYGGTIKGDRLAAFELRHLKNQLIVNATKLVSLSAIPAGVSLSEANNLANIYIRECENRKNAEEVESLQYSMVLDFCDLCAAAAVPLGGNKELLECIGYIRTHTNAHLSVADVARVIHRSESYTMKLFHDELGITITHFITRCKLEEARSLLTHTQLTLSEISSYLCFSSQSYFQNLFKKKYGITPNHYRKEYTPSSPDTASSQSGK